MSETPNAQEVQGANPDRDSSDHIGGAGNPAPAAPPARDPAKDKPNADAEDKSGDKPGDGADKSGEDEGKDTPPSNEQDTGEKPDDTPLDTEVWGTTGTEAGDSVLTLLQNSGITTDDAKAIMYDALLEGKPENINRDQLVEKVGAARANLIMIGVNQMISDNNAKVTAINDTIFNAVGGEDNWGKVLDWAKKNVSESDRTEYREMLEKGGKQGEYAAKELLGLYNAADTNTTLTPNNELAGDSLTTQAARATTAKEYHSEISAAYDRRASPAEIQEIKDARAKGRAKGI